MSDSTVAPVSDQLVLPDEARRRLDAVMVRHLRKQYGYVRTIEGDDVELDS